MLEWKSGPPPNDEGKEWIAEFKSGQISRVEFNESGQVCIVGRWVMAYWNLRDIIRHMPYEPMPEPMKPFRLFNCTRNGQRGTGAYDPNGKNTNRYRIHWIKDGLDYYQDESQLDLNGIQIEWIDDAT